MSRKCLLALPVLLLANGSPGPAQSQPSAERLPGAGGTGAARTGEERAAPATAEAKSGKQGSGASAGASKAVKPDALAIMTLIPKEAAEKVAPASTEDLYRGFRARRLLGQNVYGTRGEEIGEVQDLILGRDGRLIAVVVEGGGFLDIGDATFRIPFTEIDLTTGQDGIVAKTLTETKAEAFGLYDQAEAVATGPREFRVNELIGDYARLRQGQGYGSVRDVVFRKDGSLIAVLVNRDVRYGSGMFSYPFYGYGYAWHPGSNYYAIPFNADELSVEQSRKIDMSKFRNDLL